MEYAVQCTMHFTQTVVVEIDAGSEEQAKERAWRLFNEGAIWDDSNEAPLLYDDFDIGRVRMSVSKKITSKVYQKALCCFESCRSWLSGPQ